VAHGEPVSHLPVEDYAGLPYVQSMALSPDGARVAIVHNLDGKSVLVVRRPEEEQFVVLLTGDNERGNIGWVRWANSEKLLVGTRYPFHRGTTLTMETRLLSIPAEGGEPRSVLRDASEDRWGRGDRGTYVPQFQDQIVDMLPDEKDHILVAWDLEEENSPGVYRANLNSSRRRLEHRHIAGFSEWLTDRQHRVRVGVSRQEDRVTVHVRQADADNYQKLWSYRVFSPDMVEPLGFGADPDVLFVRKYHEGHLAVFKVDLDQPDAAQLVLALPGRDANGRLIHSGLTGEAVGLLETGGRMLMWEEKNLAFVAALERAFAGNAVSLVSMSRDEQRYLVLTSGAGNAGTFYLGDRNAGTVSPIAYRHPDLPADGIVGNKPVSFSARNGTSIRGTLTLPSGVPATGLPAIVLAEGVPTASTLGGFDYWGEFFANRGYAVLRVNFRGSSGFGADPVRGSIHGWGRTMHHDVVDGARWLVDQGVADAKRVCVVGESYGGYAALMGAIQAPELFRCAVSFAAVTDLVDLVEYANRYENPEVVEALVGSDKVQLRNDSPLALAGKVSVPLLLVHGTDDRVVRVHHGRAMHRALQEAKKRHRYVEQQGGDHHLTSQGQRLELFREMETFLAEHLANSG
jgi:dienelactone hydrolase